MTLPSLPRPNPGATDDVVVVATAAAGAVVTVDAVDAEGAVDAAPAVADDAKVFQDRATENYGH